MKKFKLLTTLLLTGLMTVNTFAIDLSINNKVVKPVQSPVLQDGTTLVPLRIISENLGATVEWNASTKTVTVNKEDKTIVLTLGSKTAKVNNEVVTLAVAPQIISNTTMLPIRFVSEQLNCDVLWDSKTQTVYVTEKGVKPVLPDTTNWRTTTISNPKIIDGKVYLTLAQMTKALDVKDIPNNNNAIAIGRADFHAYWGKASEGLNNLWFVNGGLFDSFKSVKDAKYYCINNVNYFPVEFLSEWLNCSVSYNKANNTATIIYKGPKYYETTDAQINTVSGYVKTADGKPVAGVKVGARAMSLTGPDYRAQLSLPNYVTTDANGRYTLEVDTSQVKYLFLGLDDKYYRSQSPSVATKDTQKVIVIKSGGTNGLIPSNVTELPELIAYIGK